MARLKAKAMATRARWSAYKIRACDPTTKRFLPASLIHLMLSPYWTAMLSGKPSPTMLSRTSCAIPSVTCRSSSDAEVQIQRNGPNPSEKMSLETKQMQQHWLYSQNQILKLTPLCPGRRTGSGIWVRSDRHVRRRRRRIAEPLAGMRCRNPRRTFRGQRDSWWQ